MIVRKERTERNRNRKTVKERDTGMEMREWEEREKRDDER